MPANVPIVQNDDAFVLHRAIIDRKIPFADVHMLIQVLAQVNPIALRAPNGTGATPLHLAAILCRSDIVRALLEIPSPGPRDDLDKLAGDRRMTPLVGCQETRRAFRETGKKKSQPWGEFPEPALSTEFLLKVAGGEDVGEREEAAYIHLRKFGCTCGQCYEG